MVVVLIIAFVLAASFASYFKAYLRQRSDLDALEAQIAQLQTSNAYKQAELQHMQDPNYIKILARERLGYVMPGEIAYTALDARGNKIDPQVTLDNQANVGKPTAPTPWWTTVQGSIYAAGHPTATTPAANLTH
jgi:cell division protein FtsB